MKISFSKKQAAFLDEMLSQFGQISPNISYEAIVNDRVTVVKFDPFTVKMLHANSKQIKHRHLASLCKQLARAAGVAKCNPEDTNVIEKGMRLAKLKFSKIVASIVLGTQKQIHQDSTKKIDNFTKRVNNELVKMKARINSYKGVK